MQSFSQGTSVASKVVGALTLVLLLGMGANAVEAAPRGAERLAIIRFDVSGNVPPALQRTLGERLIEGLTAVSFEVLKPGPDAVSPVYDSEGASCRDEACYRRIGQALKVSYLVAAQISERQKTFEITLELLNGRNGVTVGTNRERCEICGVAEVGEKMSLAASTLRARLEALTRAPARLVLRTNPPGAYVKIDGKSMGVTPLDLSLAAGEHTMYIEREGHTPLERRFSVTRGVDETLDLDLVRLPTAFPYRPLGWGAVATGAALAAGGIYLLGLHGSEVSCSDGERDMYNHCPRIYRTSAAGATLLGASAVMATLGGVWLYLAQPNSGGIMTGERALLDGIAVGASGRF